MVGFLFVVKAARAPAYRTFGTRPTAALRHFSVSVAAATSQQQPFDVTVIGGGVIGCSVALHVAIASPGKRIAVLERDAGYKRASAPRSAGGIRQQFSLPANVQLSLYGIDFLKTVLPNLCELAGIDANIQLRENGYLLLASPGDGEVALRENVAVQHSVGATWIKLLDPQELGARFPWLDCSDLACGAFGERNEGYFDPWALLQALRKLSEFHGVTFIDGEVSEFGLGNGGRIESVRLAGGCQFFVAGGTVVNAAGAHGGRLVSLCGEGVTPLPVVPRKRCMWLFTSNAVFASDGKTPLAPANTPLTVNTDGVYFRSEGGPGRFVCGVSPKPERDPDCADAEDLDNVDHDMFEETIWPSIAGRAPAFEALRVESFWAGFYEYNTLDQNGVVGWHPDVPNMLVAAGFSGHGLQHAPGIGRACAELIVDGGFRSVDLTCFDYERIVRGEPIFERGIY